LDEGYVPGWDLHADHLVEHACVLTTTDAFSMIQIKRRYKAASLRDLNGTIVRRLAGFMGS
jgi:hypothetical protein